MPIHWKILSKRFLLNIFLFTTFFIFITIFFKLSRLTKYFVAGADGKELLLLLSIFIYRCFPFAISLTSLGAAYLVVQGIKKTNEIKAFASLGLDQRALFSPLISLSLLLAVCNLGVGFMLTPYINKSLKQIVNEKKRSMALLPALSKKRNLGNLTIKRQKDSFIVVKADKEFSWAVCNNIKETDEGLYFYNPHYFTITKEENGHNSILLSKDSETFIPRETLFSIFPSTSLKIPTLSDSKEKILAQFFYLLYPILFTLLGILLALRVFIVPTIILLLFSFGIFTLATVSIFSFSAILSIFALTLTGFLYHFALKKYKRGAL